MEIREVEVHDDEDVLKYWEATKESDGFQRPYAAFWSLQSAMAALRDADIPFERHPMVAVVNDEVVATSQVTLPRRENTHIGYVGVHVRPSHRRRGIGSAMYEETMRALRGHGRTTAIAEVDVPLQDPSGGGRAFLERRGFSAASVELHRVLDLPVASGRLESLERETASYASGYRLLPYRDRVPDDHVEGFCAMQTAFNSEAPMGDLDLEPENWDEDRVRTTEELFRKQGRHMFATMALSPDGQVVALTEMVTADGSPDIAWQSGTLVLPEHRGHRLGMAIKLENLRRLQADSPAVRVVHSWNAEENGPMVAINETLGFRAVEYLVEMQTVLAETS